MDQIIQSLAAGINSKWKNGSANDFADLAAAELSRTGAAQYMAQRSVMEWLAAGGGRPLGRPLLNSADPYAITIYRDGLFRIEIIQRMRAATINHHHVTTGAFATICGERLNIQYSIVKCRAIGEGVHETSLVPCKLSYLLPGDVLPIHYGEDFVHNLFFVDDECLTLSIRMNKRGGPLTMQSYVGRGFSYETEEKTLDVARRVSTLENLYALDANAHDRALTQAIRNLPASQALCMLSVRWNDGFPVPGAAEVLAQRFNLDANLLIRSLDEDRRQNRLADMRNHYKKHSHRVVLGALWSAASLAELKSVWSEVQRRRAVPDFPSALISFMDEGFEIARSEPSSPFDVFPSREIESELKDVWASTEPRISALPSNSWSLSPVLKAG